MRRVTLAIGFVVFIAGIVWAQNTVFLLNTQFNAESTGNVLTTVEKKYFRAAYCQNVTALTEWSTPTSAPAVAACVTGTNTQKGVLDFADATSLSMQTEFRLPADWTSTIDVQLYWYSATTSGNVVWQVATICVADAETGDPAYNTASVATADAAKGTTNQYNTVSLTGITTTGCAAGEQMYVKVLRDAAHASDTHAATARLVGIEVTYRRAI